jgi:hypothetical protein
MKIRRLACLVAVLLLAAAPVVLAGGKGYTAVESRPISLGTSGGNADSPICFTGTLGCLVADSVDSSQQFILSNNHVLTEDINDGQTGDRITQPGRLDTSCNVVDANTVATFTTAVAIDFSSGATNQVDCALAAVEPDAVDPNGSILGLGSPYPDPVQAQVGLGVTKSGRTTGTTKGTVQYVGVTIDVSYGSGRVGTFTNQMAIGGGGFSSAGDSGSLILTRGLHPVGLLFAGGSGLTFANPIEAVLTKLGVTIVGDGSGASGGGGGGKGGGKGGGGGGHGHGKAAQVLARHAASLRAHDAVLGHGLGERGGHATIAVFLSRDDAATRAALPTSLEGVPVEVVVTGPVVAYGVR